MAQHGTTSIIGTRGLSGTRGTNGTAWHNKHYWHNGLKTHKIPNLKGREIMKKQFTGTSDAKSIRKIMQKQFTATIGTNGTKRNK